MSQNTGLGRDLVLSLDFLEAFQDTRHTFRRIIYWIQTQQRIPSPIGQPFQKRCHNAVRIVCGVVWLQSGGECPRFPDGSIAVGRDTNLFSPIDQIHVRHELCHRSHHLRCETPGYSFNIFSGMSFIQDPFPQFGHCHSLNFIVDRFVYIILYDSCDFIRLIGNYRVIPQILQCNFRQYNLGGHSFFRCFRRNPCKLIP